MVKTKTKKKVKLTVILVIVCILIAIGFLMFRIMNQSRWTNTSLTYELGEKINIKDTDVLNKEDKTFKINTSSIDEKKAGEYTVKASIKAVDGTQVRNITVKIKDSTKPKFTTAPSVIRVNYGESDYNFKRKFKASDLSKVKISVNTKKVDFEKAGTYTATAKAVDESGNVAKKTFKVIVRDEDDFVLEDEDSDTTSETESSDSNQSLVQNNTTTTQESTSESQYEDESSQSSSDSTITPENYDTSGHSGSGLFGSGY